MVGERPSLGGILRSWRERALLTQEQLAERAGVGVRTIRRLECNEIQLPRSGTLRPLADALNLTDGERAQLVAAGRCSGSVTQPTAHQLPPDVAGFVGRQHQMKEMNALLPNRSRPSTAATVTIAGAAGVGKTTLAVHWAHDSAQHFPDGQLYVNLRGFDPGGAPMSPSEAVRGFLQALGIPSEHIPVDLDVQVSLYRSMMAAKRVLLVLDNARDAQQVRPLLPGAPGCMVVVTSRNRLTGLVAREGARAIMLGLLSPQEAQQLLIERLGAARLTANQQAVNEIIHLTTRLPLAMAIVAARAATQPTIPLGALTAQLRNEQLGLDAFAVDDPAVDVRNVFSWSYRTLSTAAARLFRLLALHPGPDIGAPAVASLAGTTAGRARQLLTELSDVHLVDESTPGRYSLHDLLRAYAAEKAETDETRPEQQAAIRRILDHYQHTAYAGAWLLQPHHDHAVPGAPSARVNIESLTDHEQALRWFTAEHPILLAVIEQAFHHGFDSHSWQLAASLVGFFLRRGRWQDWIRSHDVALQAARRLDHQDGQARIHHGLGRLHFRMGHYDEAANHLWQSLKLFELIGNQVGQAHAHYSLGWVNERQGRPDDGLRHAKQALELYEIATDRAGQARALQTIGRGHLQLGDAQQAIDYCRRALVMHRQIGNQPGQADTWDSLGLAYRLLGNYHTATTCYRHAIDLYRSLGAHYDEAETLDRLADICTAVGNTDEARTALQRALDILDGLYHPQADAIRTKLHQLPSANSS